MQQYIPSLNFNEIPPELSTVLFNIAYSCGRNRLFDLGRIFATDSFLNFRFRFPFPWEPSKPTDLDNTLFELSSLIERRPYKEDGLGQIYALNTVCNCFTAESVPQPVIADYLNRLEKFLEKLFADCRELMGESADVNKFEFNSIAEIRTMLSRRGPVDGMSALEIIFGLVIGYYNIMEMGMERIQNIFNKARSMAFVGNNEDWKDQIDRSINLVYLQSSYNMLSEFLQTNSDVPTWVIKVSQGYKLIEEFDYDNELADPIPLDIDEDFLLKSQIEESKKSEEPDPVPIQIPVEVKPVPVEKKSCCCYLL